MEWGGCARTPRTGILEQRPPPPRPWTPHHTGTWKPPGSWRGERQMPPPDIPRPRIDPPEPQTKPVLHGPRPWGLWYIKFFHQFSHLTFLCVWSCNFLWQRWGGGGPLYLGQVSSTLRRFILLGGLYIWWGALSLGPIAFARWYCICCCSSGSGAAWCGVVVWCAMRGEFRRLWTGGEGPRVGGHTVGFSHCLLLS